MKRVKAVLAAAVAGAGLLAGSSVLAQAPAGGWYAGFGVGNVTAKDFCDPGGVPGLTVSSCDDKDSGWKILGGLLFSKNLAVEVAYSTGAKFNATGTIMATPVSVSAKANLLDAMGVGMLPLGERFMLLAKAGVSYWDVKVSAPGFVSESDTGLGITYGAGAQYAFSRSMSARLEWQRYPSVGDESTTGETDVDVLGAGLLFMF